MKKSGLYVTIIYCSGMIDDREQTVGFKIPGLIFYSGGIYV